MMMGYRLPVVDNAETMLRRCDSLRPVNWLERRPPASYYLNTLAVYPDYRKLGYGGLLLSEAEAQARQSGCGCIMLETGRANHGAVQFYRRNGFVPWTADGGGVLTDGPDPGANLVLGKWLISSPRLRALGHPHASPMRNP